MNAYLIYWKRPEDWGSEIYEWIMANGMGGTILTFWEISEGEVTEGTGEFDEAGRHRSLGKRLAGTLGNQQRLSKPADCAEA